MSSMLPTIAVLFVLGILVLTVLSVKIVCLSDSLRILKQEHDELQREFEKQHRIGVLSAYGFPWIWIDLKEALGMIIEHLGIEYMPGEQATAAKFVLKPQLRGQTKKKS